MSVKLLNRASVLRSTLVASAATVLVAGALVGCTPVGDDPEPTITEVIQTETPTADAVPTETEAESVAPTADPTAPVETRREVHLVIIGVEYLEGEGGIEVRSFVSDYIGEGSCIYRAVAADGTEVSVEAEALPDAQTTVCPTRVITGLTSGVWDVTVEYANEEVFGRSEVTTIEVHA